MKATKIITELQRVFAAKTFTGSQMDTRDTEEFVRKIEDAHKRAAKSKLTFKENHD
jgi:hypothetical protein